MEPLLSLGWAWGLACPGLALGCVWALGCACLGLVLVLLLAVPGPWAGPALVVVVRAIHHTFLFWEREGVVVNGRHRALDDRGSFVVVPFPSFSGILPLLGKGRGGGDDIPTYSVLF